jgi:hypothetical protein
MRTMAQATNAGNTRIDFRVKDEADSWQDISSRVFSINYSDDVDSDSCKIDVKLRNAYEKHVSGTNNSLDPLDTLSSYYVSGAPLLGRYHECYLRVSKDSGVNWYEVFRGYIGPGSVRCSVDLNGDDIIDVSPVDIGFRYKEKYWYDPLEYSDADAVSIASQIIKDQGFRGTNDSIVEIDAPGFHVEEYSTGETNVWEAIKRLLEPTGYSFRIRWDTTSSAFRACVYDPDRDNSTPNAVFSGDFRSRQIDTNEEDVRTKVSVRYRDRNSGTIRSAVAEDESARDKYGIPDGSGSKMHKEMWYAAEGTGERYSMIDTPDEAQTLADAILHDLKEPSPGVEINIPYIHPGIEVHDLLSFVGRDYTVNAGITSVSWHWSYNNEVGETTVSGTADRVIGQFKTWLEKDVRNPDVKLRNTLAFMAGDGKRPSRPLTPTLRSYWGTDSLTGDSVPIVIATTTAVQDWDLARYRWRYWIIGEDVAREETTVDPKLVIKNLPVGASVRIQVRAEDWSSVGG